VPSMSGLRIPAFTRTRETEQLVLDAVEVVRDRLPPGLRHSASTGGSQLRDNHDHWPPPRRCTGWGLDAVAFHEAAPGHYLQLSRLQLFTGLPASTDG
jgi:hypothetical protein